MEVPNFAKKKLQIKCPACGESVIIDIDYITEVGKKQFWGIAAECKKCGLEIAYRAEKKIIKSLLIE